MEQAPKVKDIERHVRVERWVGGVVANRDSAEGWDVDIGMESRVWTAPNPYVEIW